MVHFRQTQNDVSTEMRHIIRRRQVFFFGGRRRQVIFYTI